MSIAALPDLARFAHHEDIAVGDVLPELRLVPTLIDAVMYAAAMWEFQKLHFDDAWARSEGLEGAILQGPALGNILTRMLGQWAGPRGRILRLSWRNRGVAVLGKPLVCRGRVSAHAASAEACTDGSAAGRVECELDIVAADGDGDGGAILAANAAILLPRRST